MEKETHKKQHIAPVAYLMRFATNEQIGVKLKDNKNGQNSENNLNFFTTNIKNVGFIKRFYDIPSRADPKFWEKYYADKVDPLYGAPLARIISRIQLCPKETYRLEEKEKRLLARIICTQMLRVPKFINKRLENAPAIWEKLKKDIMEATKEILPDEKRQTVQDYQFSSDELKDMVLASINSEAQVVRLEKYLLARFWMIYYNDTNCSFMTSDSPAVMYNLVSKSTSSTDTGLAHLDTAVLFPLTPKILIQLIPIPSPFDSALSEDFNGRIHPIYQRDLDFVLQANLLQLDNCFQHAFMSIDAYNFIQEHIENET